MFFLFYFKIIHSQDKFHFGVGWKIKIWKHVCCGTFNCHRSIEKLKITIISCHEAIYETKTKNNFQNICSFFPSISKNDNITFDTNSTSKNELMISYSQKGLYSFIRTTKMLDIYIKISVALLDFPLSK